MNNCEARPQKQKVLLVGLDTDVDGVELLRNAGGERLRVTAVGVPLEPVVVALVEKRRLETAGGVVHDAVPGVEPDAVVHVGAEVVPTTEIDGDVPEGIAVLDPVVLDAILHAERITHAVAAEDVGRSRDPVERLQDVVVDEVVPAGGVLEPVPGLDHHPRLILAHDVVDDMEVVGLEEEDTGTGPARAGVPVSVDVVSSSLTPGTIAALQTVLSDGTDHSTALDHTVAHLDVDEAIEDHAALLVVHDRAVLDDGVDVLVAIDVAELDADTFLAPARPLVDADHRQVGDRPREAVAVDATETVLTSVADVGETIGRDDTVPNVDAVLDELENASLEVATDRVNTGNGVPVEVPRAGAEAVAIVGGAVGVEDGDPVHDGPTAVIGRTGGRHDEENERKSRQGPAEVLHDLLAPILVVAPTRKVCACAFSAYFLTFKNPAVKPSFQKIIPRNQNSS